MNVISIDIDDVIQDLNLLIREVCKLNNFDYIPVQTWTFDEYPDYMRKRFYETFHTEKVVHTPFVNNKIKNVINWINENYELHIVSSRSNIIHQSTIEKFAKEFPNILSERIHLVDGGSKIPVLKEINSILHIDDSPKVIQECLDNNINCMMISNENTLYNHSLRNSTMHIKSLDHIDQYLKILDIPIEINIDSIRIMNDLVNNKR